MFIIVLIFIGIVFVFTILSIVSPKFRGKMMSRQLKATKHMIDYSKEDLEEDTIYYKHCGSMIDSDSKFCKKCGKEQ